MWNKTLKQFQNNFSVLFHWNIDIVIEIILDVVTCEINTEIISKLFQCFISHVTTPPLKLLQNYFDNIEHVGKYSWAAISLWNYFEILPAKIISVGTSTKAEIILWNSFISRVTTASRVLCSGCWSWYWSNVDDRVECRWRSYWPGSQLAYRHSCVIILTRCFYATALLDRQRCRSQRYLNRTISFYSRPELSTVCRPVSQNLQNHRNTTAALNLKLNSWISTIYRGLHCELKNTPKCFCHIFRKT